jgi:hypothetical protein
VAPEIGLADQLKPTRFADVLTSLDPSANFDEPPGGQE